MRFLRRAAGLYGTARRAEFEGPARPRSDPARGCRGLADLYGAGFAGCGGGRAGAGAGFRGLPAGRPGADQPGGRLGCGVVSTRGQGMCVRDIKGLGIFGKGLLRIHGFSKPPNRQDYARSSFNFAISFNP